jgi:hypothetical protein|tara:strand:- start:1477 stop:1734 length:258 start_codon:yes stop_codon:yes gene_type:complete
MADKANERSKSELKEELESAIERFLNDGGQITKLRYASEEDQKKSRRLAYHLDRQHNSERSKKIVEEAKQNEDNFIFSKVERNSA